MYPIVCAGERLCLRELRTEDTGAVFTIYGSERATRHLSFPPRTREEVTDIVTRSVASASALPRQEYVLAVTERDSPELIGLARMAFDPHQQRAATLGGALHPEVWGRGYSRECLRMLLSLAFEDLDLHRLWAARSPLNTTAARLLLGAGFTEEGRIRGHVRVRGAWRDSVVYGILREEWEGGRIARPS
ncbi:GNAT family N-acetyltransferase [Streptomyces sp. NPDC057638]|uniref:GNAT family N-acetyltransferase n=1 Tax=Streptomyces sp. NPDC057638 TaxID=3346190 RepID=UPI0036A85378